LAESAFATRDTGAAYRASKAARETATGFDHARATAIFGITAIRLGLIEDGRRAIATVLKQPDRQAIGDLLPELHLALADALLNDLRALSGEEDTPGKATKMTSLARQASTEAEAAVRSFGEPPTGSLGYYNALSIRAVIRSYANGGFDEKLAQKELAEVHARMRKDLPSGHPAFAFILLELGANSSDFDSSTRHLDDALKIAERSLPRDAVTANINGVLAEILAARFHSDSLEGRKNRPMFRRAIAHQLEQIAFYRSVGEPALVTAAYEGLGDIYAGLELGAEDHVAEWVASAEATFGPTSEAFLWSLWQANESIAYDESAYEAKAQLLRRRIQIAEREPKLVSHAIDASKDLLELMQRRADDHRSSGQSDEAKALDGQRQNLAAKLAGLQNRAAASMTQADRLRAQARAHEDKDDHAAAAKAYEELIGALQGPSDRKALAETARELTILYSVNLRDTPEAVPKILKYSELALSGPADALDKEELSHMRFLRTAGLARAARWSEADATLLQALESWTTSKPEPTQRQMVRGLSQIAALALDGTGQPPSLTGDLAAILYKLPRSAVLDPGGLAAAGREASTTTDRARRLVLLALASSRHVPESFNRAYEAAMAALGSKNEPELLDALEPLLAADPNRTAAMALVHFRRARLLAWTRKRLRGPQDDQAITAHLEALTRLIPDLPHELAGNLAGDLQITSSILSDRPHLQRNALATAQDLATHAGEDGKVAAEMIREKVAKLDGKPLDFSREAAAELAALAARPPGDDGKLWIAYHFLAAKAAVKGAFAQALEAARRSSEVHRRHIARSARLMRSFDWAEAKIDDNANYFLHLALLKKAIDAGGDRKALLKEAFDIAGTIDFDAFAARMDLDAKIGSGASTAELQRRLAAAEADGKEAEAVELERKVAAAYRPAIPGLEEPGPSLGEVQASLKSGQALLLYLEAPVVSYVQIDGTSLDPLLFIVRRDRAELVELENGYEVSTGAKELLKHAAAPAQGTRGGLKVAGAGDRSARRFNLDAAHKLYSNIFAPAAAALEGIDHLLISPRSVLGQLPLHMLVTEPPSASDSPAWLARKYRLSLVQRARPSELRLKTPASGQPRRPFLGFGDPDTRRAASAAAPSDEVLEGLDRPDLRQLASLQRLPETREELQLTSAAVTGSAASRQGCPLCTGEQATEAQLRALSRSGELQAFSTISFATHGLVAGEITGLAESALVLTPGNMGSSNDDGLLTAAEAASLKLSADLVLLTACNTGVAKEGEDQAGLSDLANAFLYAGARSVLVSHWPVDSRATAHLAARATSLHKDQRLRGFEAALQKAMIEMMDGKADPKWVDPYYWAPFTLVQDAAATQ
jgi:CHAT domain-containing protein